MRARGIDVALSADLDAERGARHPERMETTIYRVAQEAISNAIKPPARTAWRSNSMQMTYA
jgi:signal transduction histidine kinase